MLSMSTPGMGQERSTESRTCQENCTFAHYTFVQTFFPPTFPKFEYEAKLLL